MRKVHSNIPILFEPDKWTVNEEGFNRERGIVNETIFTIGNGYCGVRGYFEEGVPEGVPTERSALINGVYEYHPYHHIWQRPGFPGRFHAIFAQADPFSVRVYANGELCTPYAGCEKYKRTLNMREGSMVRTFVYKTRSGKSVELKIERFADLNDVHILWNRITVASAEKVEIKIESRFCLPGKAQGMRKEEMGDDNAVRLIEEKSVQTEEYRLLVYQASVSKFRVAAALSEQVKGAALAIEKEEGGEIYWYEGVTGNGDLVLERSISYYTDHDLEGFEGAAIQSLMKARAQGFDESAKENQRKWAEFWTNADLEIDGDDLVQQGVRFSLFMLQSSVGRDGKTNIGANGLTGTGYLGHTFWDTEIFMTPAFLYSTPEVARQLLVYRYSILPNAEKRAIEMEDEGALYAWNSINGEECGHVFEAATAQYHLNCDIAYAIKRYYYATDDWEFMKTYGIEILAKMSKCLSHRGNFIEHKGGRFCINGICGPDEYNPVVNNNLYTNWLTRDQFLFTLSVLDKLKEESVEAYEAMLSKCAVDEQELSRWKTAAEKMYIGYDEALGIYLQDDDFLDKDPIDVDAIPPEKLPLLTHLHPLNLWRYQVIKQADIVLLIYLYSHQFTQEMKQKIYDFYEPKTIHDSSLSAGIHCIVAQDIGYSTEAYGYLKQAARMDLDDVNRNTFNGVHSACQGSTYMMIVNGYAGMRDYDRKLHFKPAIPKHWKQYRFKVFHRGCRVEVTVDQANAAFRLIEGKEMTLECYGQDVKLKAGEKAVCPLKNAG